MIGNYLNLTILERSIFPSKVCMIIIQQKYYLDNKLQMLHRSSKISQKFYENFFNKYNEANKKNMNKQKNS